MNRKTKVKREELLRRMQLLGLTAVELARRARVAEGTISHALNGRPIQPTTFRAIVAALSELEPVPGAADLIDDGASGQGGGGA